MKVVAAGEGVEDAEEGGGSIAQVQLQTHSHRRRHHPPPPPHHRHRHSDQPGDDDYKQAVLSLPVSEGHIAGVFKCQAKHAETSKSLFNVTKIDVQCNNFDDDDDGEYYDDDGKRESQEPLHHNEDWQPI